MDSFFKAAVCDLDKLLDDFELNSEELESKPIHLKPPAHLFASQTVTSEVPASPASPPDLNLLHYGHADGGSDGAEERPLTGVDLLSSVDHKPTQSSAPPCPDRTLKPVCDLVNDASSAMLVRDAFCQLDGLGEGLLVDFDAPLLEEQRTGSELVDQPPGFSAASVSLLDIILSTAAETAPADESAVEAEVAGRSELGDEAEAPQNPSSKDSDSAEGEMPEPISLSCLPIAASMCGALVNAKASAEGAVSASPDPAESEPLPEHRLSPEGQRVCLGADGVPQGEPSPLDPPESGFEYLPVSEQAELLVTDEELDAFLQAHAEQDASLSDSSTHQTLPDSGSEGISDRPEEQEAESAENTAVGSTPPKGRLSPPLASQEFGGASPEGSGPNHTSYGGARPKQPHCHSLPSPPAGAEEEQQAQAPPTGNVQETPVSSTSPPEESQISDPHPTSTSLESPDLCLDPDKLSEPPSYSWEQPEDAARTEDCQELGSRQPAWVPDGEAPNCMKCSQRFTFTKRRHHCRACGKVYCAGCCSRRCKLKYLEKEARVCVLCFDSIHKAQALERMMSPTGPSPNPNVPSEYCSTIPPLQQARAAGTLNSPPPTVMVPVSVLKNPHNETCPREQKRVWFADGILPNGEVADTSRLSVTSRRSSQEFTSDPATPDSAASDPSVDDTSAPEGSGAVDSARPPLSGPWDYGLLCEMGSSVKRVPSLLPDSEDELPPLLITAGEDGGEVVLVEESPAPCQILHLLEDGGPRPLAFVLNANLLVNVKLVTYSGRRCWCFGSNGLQALGQKELLVLLECLPAEKSLPRDLFGFYLSIYQDAQKGRFVDALDNVTFTSSFLGSREHAGMLLFSHSCQPLDGLALPPPPFLFGLLIHRLEVPWAKVFPLRLLLRLGAQYHMYPSTLISVRFREPVYRETGHTIMNLLADLRNYQYSLPVVEGLTIHMEMGHSYIQIPKSSFTEVQKVVHSSNEHVISIGATFSPEADSHLVCFQNEEGNYQTQANSKPGKTRTVTGASFVVFNGALKASSGFMAKSSIVEDGLMVQIPPETMESFRSALRDQTDFNIPCGRSDGGEIRENVTVRWIDWTSPINSGRMSGVDGRPLDGVHSVRMLQDSEFECDGRSISCTEVFYLAKSADCSLSAILLSCGVFQREVAMATCSALTPHLGVLSSSGINSIWLRVSTQADMVEYQAGSGGRLLPQHYMNEMDGALIPVIHGGGASVPQSAMDVEFVFFITHTLG